MTIRLDLATRAARAAGRVLRAKFDQSREIRYKGKRDIVTDADMAADRTVRSILIGRRPQDRVLSEEGDAAARKALWQMAESDPHLGLWIVDPLDGTTNYAHHIPIFCVSVALYQNHAVQVGAIYDPLRNELFAAERGGQATLNGRPIRVNSIRKLEQAVVGMEWAHAEPLRKQSGEMLARLAPRAMTVRTNGSAALSGCYIATGRLDGYFHLSLSPWDIAAAALIAEQAGARVTDMHGQPWTVHSRDYLIANPWLHGNLLRLFKRHR